MFNRMMGSQTTLESFVSDAMQWDPHNWKGFTEEHKYRDVLKILPKFRTQIDTALSSGNFLSPRKHSIAFSYLLGFRATEKMEDPQILLSFVNTVQIFIRQADARQISLFPRPFTDALRTYVDIMKRNNDLMPLIPLLKDAIALLQGGSAPEQRNLLTFAHCDMVFCCVETFCYHQAFPYVDYDIIQVQGDGCVKSADNLRYFYYCALVQIALKRYKQAMECLTMVCTAPSESLSLIQIDAYKKYVLISLIRKQCLVSLPRYTPRILTRYFPKFCSEYLELNGAFDSNANSSSNSNVAISTIIEKNMSVYMADHNYGLVQKVVRSCAKNAVKKLTSVYTKLSMQKICTLCQFEGGVEEAKGVVIAMISNGDLSASLDENGVVTFYDGTMTESDKEMLARMQSGIDKTLALWNGLDAQQLKVKTSKAYIEKSLNLGGGGMGGDEQFMMHGGGSAMGGAGGGFFGR